MSTVANLLSRRLKFRRFLWSLVSAGLIVVFTSPPCKAWWECGHHVIAVMAFDLLNQDEQRELLHILSAHPRYSQDFTPPDSVIDVDRWRIGTAGYWPDIARSQPEFDRPTWHYQLGATMTLGSVESLNIPSAPGPLSQGATLKSQELHIGQAVELCQHVFSSTDRPTSDRALALTWLAHLVGDAHQPCHAGSLYAEGVFPDGDRGANLIPVRQHENLHALWDSLLGDRYDGADIRRRVQQITSNDNLIEGARDATLQCRGLDPLTWIQESRELGEKYVYTHEILTPVTVASRGFVEEVEQINLSEIYLKDAGALARVRAATAAHRLAAIWCDGLED